MFVCFNLPHSLWDKSSFQKQNSLGKIMQCHPLFSTVLPSHHSIDHKALVDIAHSPFSFPSSLQALMALRAVDPKTVLLGSQLEMSEC